MDPLPPLLPLVAARGRGKAPPRSTASGWTPAAAPSAAADPPKSTGGGATMLLRSERTPSAVESSQRQYYAPTQASSGAPSNGIAATTGSLERAKRPDQQYYQTKRSITSAADSPTNATNHDADASDKHAANAKPSTFNRVGSFGPKSKAQQPPQQQQQQQPPSQQSSQQQQPGGSRSGGGGVRMIAELPRHTENPFMRNVPRDRRDSACSENLNHNSGGGGGGRAIVTGSNRSIWLPNNIESMPPRFQKKFLQENGLDPSVLEKPLQNGIILDKNQALFVGKPNITKTFTNTRLSGRHRSPNRPNAAPTVGPAASMNRSASFRHADSADFRTSTRSLNHRLNAADTHNHHSQQQQHSAAAAAAPKTTHTGRSNTRAQRNNRDQRRDRSDRTDRTDWTDRSPQSGRSSAMSMHRGEQQQHHQQSGPYQQQQQHQPPPAVMTRSMGPPSTTSASLSSSRRQKQHRNPFARAGDFGGSRESLGRQQPQQPQQQQRSIVQPPANKPTSRVFSNSGFSNSSSSNNNNNPPSKFNAGTKNSAVAKPHNNNAAVAAPSPELIYYSSRDPVSTASALAARLNSLSLTSSMQSDDTYTSLPADLEGSYELPPISLPREFDWNDEIDGAYDNSDNESSSFRNELNATVATMNEYYARHVNAAEDDNDNASCANDVRPSSAQQQQPQQQQQQQPQSLPQYRPPSSASVCSTAAANASISGQQQDHTQSLPHRKSRRSGRSRRSSRSSRNPSFDRQSTVSLNESVASTQSGRRRRGGQKNRQKQQQQQQQQLQQQPDQQQPKPQNRPGLLKLDAAQNATATAAAPDASLRQHLLPNPRSSRTRTASITSDPIAAFNTSIDSTASSSASNSTVYTRPAWYNPPASCRPDTVQLIRQVERIDQQLQTMLHTEEYLTDVERFARHRADMLAAYTQLLTGDVRFAHEHNLESHMWKTLYHNQVELIKRRLAQQPPPPPAKETAPDAAAAADAAEPNDELQQHKKICVRIIDEGLAMIEQMLHQLEQRFVYRLEEFLDLHAGASKRAVGTMRIALLVSESLLLHLGDLARYKEQLAGTRSFGRAKQWYTKAQHLMPTNGKPFNALAVISIQTRRRFESVYFHMRSLTASNPIESARESLKVILDENRKKFEHAQRKYEQAEAAALAASVAAKPAATTHRDPFDGPLRREIWIHPEGGRRMYRTAPLIQPAASASELSAAEKAKLRLHEELSAMDQDELNRRFIVSFLHVHGKLLTKIGMDSFQSCARLMLHELYVLLQRTPTVFASTRLVQLMAVNMFSIHNLRTRVPPSNPQPPAEPRSDAQTNALCMALAMFSLILDRVLALTREAVASVRQTAGPNANANDDVDICLAFNDDARILLPAIKVWCDWLLANRAAWQAPPALHAFGVLPLNSVPDPWSGLAAFATLLEHIKPTKRYISVVQASADAESELVRLPEDIALLGFAPLDPHNDVQPVFCDRVDDLEIVHTVYRVKRIVFLCTKCFTQFEPPALRREETPAGVAYRSTVVVAEAKGSGVVQQQQQQPQRRGSNAEEEEELLVESFSDDEVADAQQPDGIVPSAMAGEDAAALDANACEVRRLLRRKDELQRRQRMEEQNHQRLQNILRKSTVSLKIEVRPKYLVPDTNCFIDFHDQLRSICKAHPLYQLIVPLIVINELEGLSLGTRSDRNSRRSSNSSSALQRSSGNSAEHAAMVTAAAKQALAFLRDRHPAVRYVTTKGSIMTSMTFTTEDDASGDPATNDDRILLSAVNIARNSNACPTLASDGATQLLVREVVLLTTDRNLRVKALAQNVPVRELPDFIRWSGLLV